MVAYTITNEGIVNTHVIRTDSFVNATPNVVIFASV